MSAGSTSKPLGSVLVVGGCGFLGHHLVNQLCSSAEASSIAVLDLCTSRNRVEDASYTVKYHDADITSKSSIILIFEEVRPDVVFHTVSPAMTDPNKARLRKVNVEGTKNLVEVAGKVGVKSFVYTSSASVISDAKTDLMNADERWPYVPAEKQMEYYTQTKAEAEAYVLSSNRQHNRMLTCAIRPAGIIGEGDVMIVPAFLEAYKRKQTGFQLGDNNNLFDFTYVGNLADAHILAANALLKTYGMHTRPLDHERVDGEAFFITNDSPVYFWDYPRMVWHAVGDTKGLDVWVIPKTGGLVLASLLEWVMWVLGRKANLTRQVVKYSCMTRYYSCKKAKTRLGYRPRVGLEEGIKRTIAWFAKQEHEIHEKKSQ